MDQEIALCIPLPVSVNAAYRNLTGKGRVKTGQALSWETRAMHALKDDLKRYNPLITKNLTTRYKNTLANNSVSLAKLEREHSGLRYSVTYVFHFRSSSKSRDIFNFEKLLTDLLVKVGFLLDDCFISEGHVFRGEINPEYPCVDVKIRVLTYGD